MGTALADGGPLLLSYSGVAKFCGPASCLLGFDLYEVFSVRNG
jgi:hypothetical protein